VDNAELATAEHWARVNALVTRMFPKEETAFIGVVMNTYDRTLKSDDIPTGEGLLRHLNSRDDNPLITWMCRATARKLRELFGQPGADSKNEIDELYRALPWV
jgi:hypothetical protein